MSTTKQPPKQFQWRRCMELGYADGPDSNDDMAEPVCFNCGKEETTNTSSGDQEGVCSTSPSATSLSVKLSKCAKCQVATYCSRQCQLDNWKKGQGGGHKFMCSAFKRVGSDMIIVLPDDKESARQDLFQRIRLYASPYFVQKSKTTTNNQHRRGFLFVQSDSTLAEMSLPAPILANGRPMNTATKPRSVLLYFLTAEEYKKELCRDDFELAMISTELHKCIEEYEIGKEMALMMRFRCGHVAVGIALVSPDYKLCETLGEQYFGGDAASQGAVQLNLDDL